MNSAPASITSSGSRSKLERQAGRTGAGTGMATKIRVVDLECEQGMLQAMDNGPFDHYKPLGTMPMEAQSSMSSACSSSAANARTPADSSFKWVPPGEPNTVPSPVYGDWPVEVLAAIVSKSSSSLSTVTNLTTPSLSRSPSPVDPDEQALPMTPPAATTTTTLPISHTPTTIPIEQIHLHQGHFYYPPPRPVTLATPDKRAESEISRSSKGSFSSLTALSRKFSFRGNSAKAQTKKRISESVVHVRNEARVPAHFEPAPAIVIAPPDSEPAELYRPSIPRLSSRHFNSSLTRHPLAAKSSTSVASSSSSSPSGTTSPSASSTSISSMSSFASSSNSSASSSPRRAKVLKRVKSVMMPSLASFHPALLPSSTSTTSFVSISKPTTAAANLSSKREGGLILPEPLSPDELNQDNLSIAWESEVRRQAREARAARIQAAKEAAAKRLMQANMVQYRAPFIGF